MLPNYAWQYFQCDAATITMATMSISSKIVRIFSSEFLGIFFSLSTSSSLLLLSSSSHFFLVFFFRASFLWLFMMTSGLWRWALTLSLIVPFGVSMWVCVEFMTHTRRELFHLLVQFPSRIHSIHSHLSLSLSFSVHLRFLFCLGHTRYYYYDHEMLPLPMIIIYLFIYLF